MNLLTKQKETHRLEMNSWLQEGEMLVKDFGKVMYTQLYLKWISNKNLLYSTWNSAQCYVPAWMGKGFGGEMYLIAQSCPTLQPHGLKPARLLCPWGFSRPEYWCRLPCLPPGDLSNPVIKPRSPTLETDSLPSEPPGKPKNTGVGSLSLLQGIFLTQELNWCLLHYRWIL